ncbi:MAG: hypothetical protein ACRDNJ_17090 [Solirubrobacteraceae bacterium]
MGDARGRAAALIGTEAGTADIASGVFRDLVNVSTLGTARAGLLTVSLSSLMPISGGLGSGIAVSTAAAVGVLTVWLAVPTAVGAWQTATRDA